MLSLLDILVRFIQRIGYVMMRDSSALYRHIK
jgi:hypothetical protein